MGEAAMNEYRQYPKPEKRGRHANNASNPVTPVTPISSVNSRRQTNPRKPTNPKNAKNSQQNNKKKMSGPWKIVFGISLTVFLVALIALGVMAFSYWQGQNTYDEIASEAFVAPSDPDQASLDDFVVDWDRLLALNPDTVGWIYIPDTMVNYPIVHTTNNDTYLTRDFMGGQGRITTFGTIFLAAENQGDFSDINNIVYGHHMNNGSMFAVIDTFRDSSVFNQHRTVYLLTPNGNYKITTFSLLIVPGSDPLVQASFASDEERIAYFQDKIDRSVVTADSPLVTAEEIGKAFALVTCDYTISDGRAVLFGTVTASTNPNFASAVGSGSIAGDEITNVEDAEKEIG
jgi:sortase B